MDARLCNPKIACQHSNQLAPALSVSAVVAQTLVLGVRITRHSHSRQQHQQLAIAPVKRYGPVFRHLVWALLLVPVFATSEDYVQLQRCALENLRTAPKAPQHNGQWMISALPVWNRHPCQVFTALLTMLENLLPFSRSVCCAIRLVCFCCQSQP